MREPIEGQEMKGKGGKKRMGVEREEARRGEKRSN